MLPRIIFRFCTPTIKCLLDPVDVIPVHLFYGQRLIFVLRDAKICCKMRAVVNKGSSSQALVVNHSITIS